MAELVTLTKILPRNSGRVDVSLQCQAGVVPWLGNSLVQTQTVVVATVC